MPSDDPDLVPFREEIRGWGLSLGFQAVGFASPVNPMGYDHYTDWLSSDCHAGMGYMLRQAELRKHPSSIQPDVATVIVALLNYKPIQQKVDGSEISHSTGHVAAYAQGQDYHAIFWSRLGKLLEKIQSVSPEVKGRAIADSAPLMERDYARLAGLGWIGKNTCQIHKKIGSFTLIGELLIDLALPPDKPFIADHCGSCTRCLDACPTQAFDEPYRLNANKCISYWTIEHKGLLPDPIAENLHGWVFGCDICQQVCPWNRKSPAGSDPDLLGDGRFMKPDLLEWLRMPKSALNKIIKGTALERTKRSGLVRNAIAVLTHSNCHEAVIELQRLAEDDPDEIVRESAKAALQKLASRKNREKSGDVL